MNQLAQSACRARGCLPPNVHGSLSAAASKATGCPFSAYKKDFDKIKEGLATGSSSDVVNSSS